MIQAGGCGLPFAVSPHFASLAGPEPDDPIRRQFMPNPLEALEDPFALDDPLGEELYRITQRLVHQYPDRALLLAGGPCAGHCRYCFRRARIGANSIGSDGIGSAFISAAELKPVLAWLERQGGVRELLVSGGDPLGASDELLEELFTKLRRARADLLIRLCSRVPVTNPARMVPDTIGLLARFKPLRLVTHINHPRELAPPARAALGALVQAGIPVYVQTVLLRGINDRAETLAALFRECFALGLIPYYLFQLDLAPGTRHFRVPLREGLAIYRELQSMAAPDEAAETPAWLPAYAVDLPGGGGKIRLHESVIADGMAVGRADSMAVGRVQLLKGPGGKLWEYPAD